MPGNTSSRWNRPGPLLLEFPPNTVFQNGLEFGAPSVLNVWEPYIVDLRVVFCVFFSDVTAEAVQGRVTGS